MLLQRAKLMVAGIEMWMGRLLHTVHLALLPHFMAWIISFMRFHCQAPRPSSTCFIFLAATALGHAVLCVPSEKMLFFLALMNAFVYLFFCELSLELPTITKLQPDLPARQTPTITKLQPRVAVRHWISFFKTQKKI
jgi:hypothetical protein